MSTSTQSDVGKLASVVMRSPRDAFGGGRIEAQWRELNYTAAPDLERAVEEHVALAALLESLSVKVRWLDGSTDDTLDSIYVRDAGIMTDRGLVLCSMGKPARASEPSYIAERAKELDLVVYGAIEGEGRLEGGDVTWIGPDTVAVGLSYRTNDEGVVQLEHLLGQGIDVIRVPLPHWMGPDDIFHLMSVISPIDTNLALVYSRLLPVPFRQELLARGMELVEVPDEEFGSMGCNVLAVGPRQCVVLAGNPVTRSRLEDAGATVHEFSGSEVSLKGQGGPTCLTLPVEREAVWG